MSPLRLIGPLRPILAAGALLAGPPAIAPTTNPQDTNAPNIRDVQQPLKPDQAAAAAALKGRPMIAQGEALGVIQKSELSPERAT